MTPGVRARRPCRRRGSGRQRSPPRRSAGSTNSHTSRTALGGRARPSERRRDVTATGGPCAARDLGGLGAPRQHGRLGRKGLGGAREFAPNAKGTRIGKTTSGAMARSIAESWSRNWNRGRAKKWRRPNFGQVGPPAVEPAQVWPSLGLKSAEVSGREGSKSVGAGPSSTHFLPSSARGRSGPTSAALGPNSAKFAARAAPEWGPSSSGAWACRPSGRCRTPEMRERQSSDAGGAAREEPGPESTNFGHYSGPDSAEFRSTLARKALRGWTDFDETASNSPRSPHTCLGGTMIPLAEQRSI